MFIILLSIVFTTGILAAPAPTHNQTSLEWSKLKEHKDLQQFRSTLLNDTTLPFLKECYNDQGEHSNPNSIKSTLCSNYFDFILQLRDIGYSVTGPAVVEVRDQIDNTIEFCEQTHFFPILKYYVSYQTDFNSRPLCGKLCMDDDIINLKPKPICRFIAWMGDELWKSTHYHAPEVSSAVAPAAPPAPAAAPTKVSQVADVSLPKISHVIKVLPNKTIETVEKKNQEVIKPEAVPEKAATNISKVPVKLPPTIISTKTPIKIEAKESSTTGAAAVPEDQINPVKKIHEDKDYNAPATLNSDAQGQIEAEPNPKIISDKQGGSDENLNTEEESNGDDNVGDNEMDSQTDVKANNVDIGIPDIEHNHSSSQEIVNSNIVPTSSNDQQKDPFHEQSGSNFFTYFLIGMFLCIAMYVFYHNKSKILALVLEGRRGDKGRSGRRKHTAAYRKLDSNLEEAITSSARGRTTQIIY